MFNIYNYHSSWKTFFENEQIIKILYSINSAIGDNYFPENKNVLRFLNTDLENVKCVIVGMDPYPSEYLKEGELYPVATGRSFEVGGLVSWQEKFKQSSLRNILKTIYYNDTGNIISLKELRLLMLNDSFKIAEPEEWFNSLEKQGVLFLNAALTVKPGLPKSHFCFWEPFTVELINYLDTNKKGLKWLLWGNDAQNLVAPLINNGQCIYSCHPRLSAFVKENCFKKVTEINWRGEQDEI